MKNYKENYYKFDLDENFDEAIKDEDFDSNAGKQEKSLNIF